METRAIITRTVGICPSILAADIGRLDHQVELVSNADMIHVDVMDGHFVPNVTWGLPVAKAVVNQGLVPVDVHLMIEDPDRWAPAYAEAGCRSITFHAEAATAPLTLARTLRSLGAKAALGFRPTTNPEPFRDYLDEFDMVLVMTVEPGFGGQTFLKPAVETVRKIREWAGPDLDLDIQVDGGIDRRTIGDAARAGANLFVAGSSVFGSDDPRVEVDVLRDLAIRASV